MQDKVLALVDGSAYSESVCHHTAWVAGKLDAAVEVLHVLDRREGPVHADYSGALGLGARTALLSDMAELDARRAKLSMDKGHAILEDAKAIIRGDGRRDVKARLQRGDLLTVLAEAERDARVVVIGKRGEGADVASEHLGSNLERAVRASTRPMLIASQRYRPVARVLMAFDGSASNMRAIARIVESPVFRDLEIHLVHAGARAAAIDARLQTASEQLTRYGLPVTTEIVEGEAEDVLPPKVARDAFDMVIMGAYGHSRMRNLIVGSTTTVMIQSCKVPLLVYR